MFLLAERSAIHRRENLERSIVWSLSVRCPWGYFDEDTRLNSHRKIRFVPRTVTKNWPIDFSQDWPVARRRVWIRTVSVSTHRDEWLEWSATIIVNHRRWFSPYVSLRDKSKYPLARATIRCWTDRIEHSSIHRHDTSLVNEVNHERDRQWSTYFLPDDSTSVRKQPRRRVQPSSRASLRSYFFIGSIIAVFQLYVWFVKDAVEIFMQTIEKEREKLLWVMLLEIGETRWAEFSDGTLEEESQSIAMSRPIRSGNLLVIQTVPMAREHCPTVFRSVVHNVEQCFLAYRWDYLCQRKTSIEFHGLSSLTCWSRIDGTYEGSRRLMDTNGSDIEQQRWENKCFQDWIDRSDHVHLLRVFLGHCLLSKMLARSTLWIAWLMWTILLAMSNPCYVFPEGFPHCHQNPLLHKWLRPLIQNPQDEDHSRLQETSMESFWTEPTDLIDFGPYPYLFQGFTELDGKLIG